MPDDILLICITPGPKEPSDFPVLTEMQVDELLMGFHHGTSTTNHLGEEFVMRIFLYGAICDYKGMVKWLRITTSSALVGACWLCEIVGFWEANRSL